ncbi:hypothetical protein CIB48_g2680 [Xylaria polymorpha]|nr:hypothetical protein CIB48_g2680 [Xylaria polymorpha]
MEGSNPDIRPGGKATDYMSGFPLSFLLRFCVAVAAIGDQVSSDKPKSETSYKLSSTLTLAHDMQVYVPETRKIAPVQPWGDGPSSVPAAENFLRRIGTSVTVLGDYLYIDGGTITQLIDGKPDPQLVRPVNETLSMSLAETWSNSSPSLVPITKAAPNFLQAALWTDLDEQTFYMWGGQSTNPVPGKREVWKFTADGGGGGAWSLVQPANPGVFVGIKRGRGASWTTCNGLGLALGGYGWAGTDADLSDHSGSQELPLPGLLSYQLSTGTWSNQSAEAFNGLEL